MQNCRTHLPGTADVQSWLDALCKSRHAWRKSNNESDEGTPVDAMIVPVDAAVSVELVNVELLLLNQIIIADHDPGKWAHQARIAGQEGK